MQPCYSKKSRWEMWKSLEYWMLSLFFPRLAAISLYWNDEHEIPTEKKIKIKKNTTTLRIATEWESGNNPWKVFSSIPKWFTAQIIPENNLSWKRYKKYSKRKHVAKARKVVLTSSHCRITLEIYVKMCSKFSFKDDLVRKNCQDACNLAEHTRTHDTHEGIFQQKTEKDQIVPFSNT